MYCAQPLSYTIRQGDTLDRLAGEYRTTVPMIVAHNLNIDPENLRVGSTLVICPGKGLAEAPGGPKPPEALNASRAFLLSNNMREAWEQHVYWTRLLLISIAERLKDQTDTANRVLQNPGDIAALFACCYPPEITRKITQLVTEHLKIGSSLITALRDGKTAEADTLKRQWYANADKMADFFGGMNPHYDREELRKMFYTHLQMTSQEVATRLAGNYPADIEAMGEVEREALMMADYFTAGLIKQFPAKFS